MVLTIVKVNKKEIIYDFLAIATIYFMPALSHTFSVPFYVIDPFRLLVLTSFVISGRMRNALMLAITLPIFSFLVSGHPIFLKTILIITELLINVGLLILLKGRIRFITVSVLISIWGSKVCYYVLKYFFVTTGLLHVSLVSTSIALQVIVSVLTSILFGYWLHCKEK